jgi:uncharacterized membrane protein
MIAKHRLDGLTDAVFGVAMTLLVIDLRLPESFLPRDAAELWRAVSDLSTQFLAFAISFVVLARRWVGLASLTGRADAVPDGFAPWAFAHLFLTACMPFSTMLVGRFDQFAPSIAIYGLNVILAALVMLRLVGLAAVPAAEANDRRAGLIALIVVALISVAVGLFRPTDAMWAYLLLVAVPAWRKWRTRTKS